MLFSPILILQLNSLKTELIILGKTLTTPTTPSHCISSSCSVPPEIITQKITMEGDHNGQQGTQLSLLSPSACDLPPASTPQHWCFPLHVSTKQRRVSTVCSAGRFGDACVRQRAAATGSGFRALCVHMCF